MSAEHKRLLRLAAEEMDTINDKGMCRAMVLALQNEYPRYIRLSDYSDCKELLVRMYLNDSPHRDWGYWMGPPTPENKQHRVMALLFAAEAYDDMEGV